jgi:hypothetical protein
MISENKQRPEMFQGIDAVKQQCKSASETNVARFTMTRAGQSLMKIKPTDW